MSFTGRFAIGVNLPRRFTVVRSNACGKIKIAINSGIKAMIILLFCGAVLDWRICAMGAEPTTMEFSGQRVGLFGRSHSVDAAITQLGEMLDSPDERIQVQGLLAAANIAREHELPLPLVRKMESFLESTSKAVREAAGYALYCTRKFEPSEPLRKALRSPHPLIKFYAASSMLHVSVSSEDLDASITTLLELVKMAPDVDPRSQRVLDRDKAVLVNEANAELKKLSGGDTTYPKDKGAPLAAIGDMPAAMLKGFIQDHVDEITNWWKEHRVAVIDEIATRNRAASTQPVSP